MKDSDIYALFAANQHAVLATLLVVSEISGITRSEIRERLEKYKSGDPFIDAALEQITRALDRQAH
ncbi:hypothetical protein NEJ09_004056 [Salmonella enterica]|nr:hypothetical protein [Salmonella enterica]EBG5293749.1 hypothetical protein [Salmonella enterica subsp. enterica]HCM1854088.1 hypothetical protein [Salmonella enterica subsp. arizonae serovar 56:z4,z23:-]EBB1398644.1 hypothetical protein [Salmonella enterica]EDI9917952.1 hypothetical protein [Salmonella enterica]